jgi:hypothetical protein
VHPAQPSARLRVTQRYPEGDEYCETLARMDSQAVRDGFLEALAETSEADDGGLFALVVFR